MLRQQAEIPIQIDVRRHLDDEIDATAARRCENLVGVFLRLVIDDDVGAVLARGGHALVAAAAADDAKPARVRELHGRDPDAAGRAVHEDRLARLRVRALKECAVRRAVRHAQRGALAERRSGRQGVQLR